MDNSKPERHGITRALQQGQDLGIYLSPDHAWDIDGYRYSEFMQLPHVFMQGGFFWAYVSCNHLRLMSDFRPPDNAGERSGFLYSNVSSKTVKVANNGQTSDRTSAIIKKKIENLIPKNGGTFGEIIATKNNGNYQCTGGTFPIDAVYKTAEWILKDRGWQEISQSLSAIQMAIRTGMRLKMSFMLDEAWRPFGMQRRIYNGPVFLPYDVPQKKTVFLLGEPFMCFDNEIGKETMIQDEQFLLDITNSRYRSLKKLERWQKDKWQQTKMLKVWAAQ